MQGGGGPRLLAADAAHIPACGCSAAEAGGSLLADDDAQDSLLEQAGRADTSAPGDPLALDPLALDSAGALTDLPLTDACEPSISGDDAHADVGAAGQGANQPASATGVLDADEVSWNGTYLRAYSPANLLSARPTRTLLTSLMTRRRLSTGQMGLCCLSLRRLPASLVAMVLPLAAARKPATGTGSFSESTGTGAPLLAAGSKRRRA